MRERSPPTRNISCGESQKQSGLQTQLNLTRAISRMGMWKAGTTFELWKTAQVVEKMKYKSDIMWNNMEESIQKASKHI